MSFGFSIGDFAALVRLARQMYRDCKAAPAEFHEAGRAAKGLSVILDELQPYVQDPQSRFQGDDTNHFTIITLNCRVELLRLDKIISKHRSLGTLDKRLRHRFKLPIQELQDIRSKLTYHISNLSTFLQTIGLKSLGRLEGKMDNGFLGILEAIDRVAAEMRAGRREGTVLTDYTNDETSTWKQFRRELIGDGYTSEDLQKHKEWIKILLKHMSEEGLLDEACPDEMNETEL